MISGAGIAVPNVDLSLSATGAAAPSTVKTNASGVATVALTATSADGVHLKATTEPLPATLPTIYTPTTVPAARNGQRLAAADAQQVSGEDEAAGSKAQISVTSTADPAALVVGGQSSDKVTIAGALPSYRGKIAVRLYGPFRTVASVSCTTTPVAEGSFTANGSGSFKTQAVTLSKPGIYEYQETAAGDENHIGFTTPCNLASERAVVRAQPTLHTVVSAQTVAPGGASITDSVTVSGLAGEHVTVQAALYGPFPARDAIACTGTPAWTGTIDVTADGTFQTEAHVVTTPGYYTYYESIAAAEFVRATKTACAETTETAIVTGQPKLQTRVSAQRAKPGGTISDKVVVTGSGVLSLSIQAALYGPFATHGAISCSGTPLWKGILVTKGDGTYTTAAVKVDKAGYYTYHETMAATPASGAASTDCAETAETTFVFAQPTVTTLTSSEVVRPGASIYDRVQVGGLGETPARIGVELFGPFSDPRGDHVLVAPPRCHDRHGARRRAAEDALVPPVEGRLLHVPGARARLAAGRRGDHSLRAGGGDVARPAGDHHRARRPRPLRPRWGDDAEPAGARPDPVPRHRRTCRAGRDRHRARRPRRPASDRADGLVEGRLYPRCEGRCRPDRRARRQSRRRPRRILQAATGEARRPGHRDHTQRTNVHVPRRVRAQLPEAQPAARHLLAQGPPTARARHLRRAVHRVGGPLPRQRRPRRRARLRVLSPTTHEILERALLATLTSAARLGACSSSTLLTDLRECTFIPLIHRSPRSCSASGRVAGPSRPTLSARPRPPAPQG